MIGHLLNESIRIAIAESNLESIRIILQFSSINNIEIQETKLINICKFISFKLNSTESKQDLKLELFDTIFEKFALKITSKTNQLHNHDDYYYYIHSNSEESLFSICFEFTDPKIYSYLLDVLKKHETNKLKLQEILIEAFINKMKRSFECNIRLIEILLQHINNKKMVYHRLIRYDKGRLIKPTDNNLKSSKLLPPKDNGYSKIILNSYFIKQQLLIKYDVIPINKRLFWLANYIYYWTIVCSNRSSSYVSATSMLRFMSIDEIIDLITNYFKYLIENGLINIKKKSSITWWYNLKKRNKMSMLNNQDKNRLESSLISLYETNRKSPFSLKMISRNRVRFLINSLSNENMQSLKLPSNLISFIKCESND